MATELAKAYVQIIPSAEGISDNISKALGDGEATGKQYGTQLGAGISGALKMGGAAIAGLGAAAVGLGKTLVDNANAASQMGDNVDKMSQKLGISAQSYQEWDYVLNLSGTSMQNMSTGMKTLTNKLDEAKSGSADAQNMFAQLGISLEELQNMSREDIFEASIKGFQGLEDSTERAALANDLFGKSGQELTPLFNTSAEETAELIKNVNDLGGVMSDEAVKSSAGFVDAMTNLQTAMSGARNGIATEMLPALTDLTNGFAQLLSGDMEGASELIKNGVTSLIESLTNAVPEIIDVIGTMASAIMEVAPDLITALADGIISALPELTPTLVDLVLNISEQLIGLLPQLIEAGVQIILQLVMGLASALPDLIPAIVDVVITITNTLIDNIDLLIDGAIALIMGLTNGLINALPQLIERLPEIVLKIADALINNAPKLMEAGLQLILTLGKALIQYTPQLLAKVPELVVQLVGKFLELREKFKDIGKNIVDGIKEGLAKAWDKIIDWLKGKCGEMIDTVKSFFGIHSPSTLFRDEVGYNLAAGIGVGFSDEMDNVNKMIDDSLASEFDLSTNANIASTLSTSQPMASGLSDSSSIGDLLNKLNSKLDSLGNQQIVLDSGVLVGETAPLMNTALGKQARREAYA